MAKHSSHQDMAIFKDLHDALTTSNTSGQVIYAHMTDLSDARMQAATLSDETTEQVGRLLSLGALCCTDDTCRRHYPHLCCVALLKTHFLKPQSRLSLYAMEFCVASAHTSLHI